MKGNSSLIAQRLNQQEQNRHKSLLKQAWEVCLCCLKHIWLNMLFIKNICCKEFFSNWHSLLSALNKHSG